MDNIQFLWQCIEAWMYVHAPHSWAKLLPGATESDIKFAESTMTVTLPDDFKAAYRLHNGGYNIEIATEMTTLPINEIIAEWQMLKEVAESGTWGDIRPYYLDDDSSSNGRKFGPLQPVWWHLQWIPFATDSGGNLSCLDLAPPSEGSLGQIIDWDHEVGPSYASFISFEKLLATFVDDLKSDKYVDTVNGLILRSQD